MCWERCKSQVEAISIEMGSMAESGISVLLPGDRERLRMDTMCLKASPSLCRCEGQLLSLPLALGCTGHPRQESSRS